MKPPPFVPDAASELTRRDLFAAAAMHGLLAAKTSHIDPASLAILAWEYADALIDTEADDYDHDAQAFAEMLAERVGEAAQRNKERSK